MADSLTVYRCPEHGTTLQVQRTVVTDESGREFWKSCADCQPVVYVPRDSWLGWLTSDEAVEAVARTKFPVMASAWLEQRVRDEVRRDLERLRALYESERT